MAVFTARQIVDAMRAGGYPKLTNGEYIQRGNWGEVKAACVYGQTALRLGVNPKTLDDAFEAFLMKIVGIVNYYEPHAKYLNDHTDLSVPQIADLVKLWLTDLNVDLDRSRIQVGA